MLGNTGLYKVDVCPQMRGDSRVGTKHPTQNPPNKATVKNSLKYFFEFFVFFSFKINACLDLKHAWAWSKVIFMHFKQGLIS